MLGAEGPNRFLIVVFAAVLFYSLVISYRLWSSEVFCARNCLQPSCKKIQSGGRADSSRPAKKSDAPAWAQELEFDDFNNETGTADGRYIVPNYVHFIKFGQSEYSFVHAVCVLSAFKNQRPEKLFIHTDLDGFRGKYWDVMMNTTGFKEALVIHKMQVPTEIFGQKLREDWKYYHGGDVARLQIMMEFGGIYLDSDSYVVRSLDDFRRYEMTLGWEPGRDMGNQIIVAHKNARFLHLWYESYRNNYESESWFYNAGKYPTHHILDYQPFLVHRVEKLFGVYNVKQKIFLTDFPEWRDYYTFHLVLSRLKFGLRDPTGRLKYPVVFTETNVHKYPVAFLEMCKAVYPFNKMKLKVS